MTCGRSVPGRSQFLSVGYNYLGSRNRYAGRMLQNRITTPERIPCTAPSPRRGTRDRRFEALYMQSFVEMRARNPKSWPAS